MVSDRLGHQVGAGAPQPVVEDTGSQQEAGDRDPPVSGCPQSGYHLGRGGRSGGHEGRTDRTPDLPGQPGSGVGRLPVGGFPLRAGRGEHDGVTGPAGLGQPGGQHRLRRGAQRGGEPGPPAGRLHRGRQIGGDVIAGGEEARHHHGRTHGAQRLGERGSQHIRPAEMDLDLGQRSRHGEHHPAGQLLTGRLLGAMKCQYEIRR